MKIKFLISMFLTVLFLSSTVLGQEYQKAKEILKATVISDVDLFQRDTNNSKKIMELSKNTTVLVYGKLGSFLDVSYQNLRGWAESSSFLIQGAAEKNKASETIEIQPSFQNENHEEKQIESISEIPTSIRVNPYVTYVMKGKSFDNQIRLGFESTYALSESFSFGGVLDAVFIHGTYLNVGPILKNEWKRQSYFLNPSMYLGLMYYKFNHNSEKDMGLGFQWAIENELHFFKKQSAFRPVISMKAGADLMFFYFDEVRIPIWVSLGAAYRF